MMWLLYVYLESDLIFCMDFFTNRMFKDIHKLIHYYL
jgi:hypothetical protein